jgi:hypothetical protein
MNAADRKKRDDQIERLYRQNTPQAVIGRSLGLNSPRVHAILVARGLLPTPTQRVAERVMTIWDLDDSDRLRRAIYKRQREGARAALAAMIGEKR